MKIIFFGTPSEVVPVLEILIKHYTVVAVVTTPDQKAGRNQQLTPPPVKIFADGHDIPIMQPNKLSTSIKQLSSFEPDLFVVAAYGKIIPQEVLKIPSYGAINIHPSLLPQYRGSTPIQTALLNGDSTTGISFIKMDAEMDHGALLKKVSYPIKATDTFGSLMKEMFAKSAALLPNLIDDFVNKNLKPKTQNEAQATFTRSISKQDGYIDITNPPEQTTLDRMIRAYYPWPTVWTTVTINNKELKLKLLPENHFQLEGKKPVSKKDLFNGYPQLKLTLAKLLSFS